MSRRHQQSSVLPLMTWPSHTVTSNRSPPGPAKASEKQEEIPEVTRAGSSQVKSRDWVQRTSHLEDEAADIFSSRGPFFQQDRRTIRLLEEHWHSVSKALEKFSSDVTALRSQVLTREKADVLTSDSVRNLGLQQATIVQDLRSRIGRCDSSIAVISSDIRSLAQNLSSVNKQLALLSTDMEKGSKDVDTKVQRLQTDLEEKRKEQNQTKSTTERRLEESLTSVEFKTKGQLRELKDSIQAVQVEYQTKQKKLQQELAETLEQLTGRHQQNQAHFEKQVTEKLESLETNMRRLESEQGKLKEDLEMRDSDLKNLINRQLVKMEDKLMGIIKVQIKGVESNMQSGLGTMQANLETMRRVLEGKQQLSEETLKKDIARMKKLVVLT